MSTGTPRPRSADGNWEWDGERWIAVAPPPRPPPPAAPYAPAPPYAPAVSPAAPAALQQEIVRFVGRGYRVLAQTSDSAQLVRPKQFSLLWSVVWFLFCGVGVLVYVFYYANKKDETVYLTAAAAEAQVQHRRMQEQAVAERQRQQAEQKAIRDAARAQRQAENAIAQAQRASERPSHPQSPSLALFLSALLAFAAVIVMLIIHTVTYWWAHPGTSTSVASPYTTAVSTVLLLLAALLLLMTLGTGIWAAVGKVTRRHPNEIGATSST